MKKLFSRAHAALENICHRAEFYGPEHGPHRQPPSAWRSGPVENGAMLDILMLAIGLGCFALLDLYGAAGERL